MEFPVMAFRKVMLDSGLTKAELAKLYGVSRQTLYTWRDTPPKQQTLAERAAAYTSGLIAAINRNLLPFPASTSREQRDERLLKMAQALHKLTAPKA